MVDNQLTDVGPGRHEFDVETQHDASRDGTHHHGSGQSMTGSVGTGIAIAKAIPWTQIWKVLKALFSARIAVVGPAAGGKTTFIDVINNSGRLVARRDHEMTIEIVKGNITRFSTKGPLADQELVLRSIDDTPGQKSFTSNIIDYFYSYKPRLLIIVVDVSRPFKEVSELAERDTGKWFESVRLKAQKSKNKFEEFIEQLGCVIIILNKFDQVHEILASECRGNSDYLNRRLKEHGDWYRDNINAEIKKWFDVGGRSYGEGDSQFFRMLSG